MYRNIMRADIELVSVEEIDSVMMIDAPSVANNATLYSSRNRLSYYILINTWLLCLRMYSKYGWLWIKSMILNHGLIYTIAYCDNEAKQFIQGEDISSLSRNLIRDIDSFLESSRYNYPIDYEKNIPFSTPAAFLFLMRYAKRFSPVSNDKIQEETLRSVIANENRIKRFYGGWHFAPHEPKNFGRSCIVRHNGYPKFIIDRLRAIISEELDWVSILHRISQKLHEPSNLVLPTGKSMDAKVGPGNKVVALSKSNPEIFYQMFGYNYAPVRLPSVWEHQFNGRALKPVRVSAIPKSYKSSRVVAPEPVYRQGRAALIANIIMDYLPHNINIRDQSQNQKLARAGSINGSVGTVDLKSASDSISYALYKDIFPTKVTDILDEYLPNWLIIKSRTGIAYSEPMQMMATMGNSLTFVLESIVFYACAVLARDLSCIDGSDPMIGICTHDGNLYPIPSVYGDDLIIDTATYGTLIDILSYLGFIVNEDKSFCNPEPVSNYTGEEFRFRESCGGDYINGEDVSSYYYPRSPIEGSISVNSISFSPKTNRDSRFDSSELKDSLTRVIELQHRLYRVCQPASMFLGCIVTEYYPSMTNSPQESSTGDLWGYEDTFKQVPAPAGEFSHISINGREEVKLVRISVENMVRRKKCLPRVYYPPIKVDPDSIAIFRMYQYQTFLQKGPSYSEPLLELLGISDKPLTINQAFSKPIIKWGFIETDYIG